MLLDCDGLGRHNTGGTGRWPVLPAGCNSRMEGARGPESYRGGFFAARRKNVSCRRRLWESMVSSIVATLMDPWMSVETPPRSYSLHCHCCIGLRSAIAAQQQACLDMWTGLASSCSTRHRSDVSNVSNMRVNDETYYVPLYIHCGACSCVLHKEGFRDRVDGVPGRGQDRGQPSGLQVPGRLDLTTRSAACLFARHQR